MIAVFQGLCRPDLRVAHSQYRRKERGGKKLKKGKKSSLSSNTLALSSCRQSAPAPGDVSCTIRYHMTLYLDSRQQYGPVRRLFVFFSFHFLLPSSPLFYVYLCEHIPFIISLFVLKLYRKKQNKQQTKTKNKHHHNNNKKQTKPSKINKPPKSGSERTHKKKKKGFNTR